MEYESVFVVVDEHDPLRTGGVRSPKSPRITPVLKQLVRERDILKIKAIQSKDPKDCYVFKKARNSMNSMRYTSQHGQREPIQVRIQKE